MRTWLMRQIQVYLWQFNEVLTTLKQILMSFLGDKLGAKVSFNFTRIQTNEFKRIS